MDAIQLTSPGLGAIAVYLLSGTDALAIIRQCCGPNAANISPGEIKRVRIMDGAKNIDDALLVALSSQTFELHLHGGIAVVQAVAQLLERLGATLRAPQPNAGFQFAAACGIKKYQYGIGAEILTTLPQARTLTIVELLAHQLQHGLGAWRTQWLDKLSLGTFPLWQFQSESQWLLDRSQTLRLFLEPPRIAIIGPPNAGKSTLVNALLGRPVSITSDIPGTTRDWVDALGILTTANIQLPAIFVDTAGVRVTPDPIEHESIRRSHAQRRLADAIIIVLDGSQPHTPAALELLHTLTQDPALPPCVLALNKSDSPTSPVPITANLPTFHISALTHHGLQNLITALMHQLDLTAVHPYEPFAFTARQRTILTQAATTHTIQQALQLLTAL